MEGSAYDGRPRTSVSLGQREVGTDLLVQANVPAHFYLVLGLGFLQLLVIISLQLHQGAKDVLVLEAVLVPDRMVENIQLYHSLTLD